LIGFLADLVGLGLIPEWSSLSWLYTFRNPVVDAIRFFLIAGALSIFIFIKISKEPKLANIITILTTLVIFLGLYWFTLLILREPRTIYFVVDASEQMEGLLNDVQGRVELKTMTIPRLVETGLTVFGGRLSGKNDCDDSTEQVAPMPKEKSVPEIIDALNSLTKIRPGGFGGMQNALTQVLGNFANREGQQEIIVITGGIDHRCEELDRQSLDKLANKDNIDYVITVLTIPGISESDQRTLENFAGEGYITLKSKDDLAQVINDIITTPRSFYYYGYFK